MCNGAVVMNLIKVFSSPWQKLCVCARKHGPSHIRCDLWPFPAPPTSVARVGSFNPSSLIGLGRPWLGLGCWARGSVGLGLGCSSGHLVTTLVVAPPWVRSEENVLVLGTSRSRWSSGHVSWAWEGQWPVSSCGRTEKGVGYWWAGFAAGNGRVRLEELTALWVPVECISGFSNHTLVHTLINVSGRMYVPYPTFWCGRLSVWRQRPRKLRQ